MRLSLLVLVLVRVQCVFMLLYSVTLFLRAMADRVWSSGSGDVPRFGIPIFALLLAVTAWALAPSIAAIILGKRDTTVTTTGLSLLDVYRATFVCLGLYFALSSVAPTLTWAHYTFGVAARSIAGNPEERRSLYQLLDPAITLGLGLLCVMKGSVWAQKLTDRDRGVGPTGPPSTGSTSPSDSPGVAGGPPSVS